MSEMTLQEALQTNEVKGFLGGQIRETVQELLQGDDLTTKLTEAATAAATAAVTAALPQIQESVRSEVAKDTQLRSLHAEALSLIEAGPLKGAAKANLLEDYGLVESDEGELQAGRALRLIEAELDGDGKVTKAAKVVLRESVEADVKRQRNILRESAPSVPRAPGGGDHGEATTTPPKFGGKGSAWADQMRQRGLNPEQFGAHVEPAAAS